MGVRPPDISQMSPEERATRLFDRVMILAQAGKEDSVHPLTPIEVPQRHNERISIGDNPSGGHEPFTGMVGSVMIYNRPLAAPEASKLFMGTRARFK